MEITKTKRLALKYPASTFYAIIVEGLPNSKHNSELEAEKRKVEAHIANSFESYAKKIEERGEFFRRYGKSFPVEYQLKTIAKGSKIPAGSTTKDLFFMTELKNCAIMSAQDLDTLNDKIVFDLSEGGEDFIYMDGKNLKIKPDDILLKQDDEVLISFLLGAGKSTLITEKTKNVLFMVWSDINISEKDLGEIVKDLKTYVGLLSDNKISIRTFDVKEETNDFLVTPWDVKGDVDYDRLIRQFGTEKIDEALLNRIKRHTGELHPYLTRKIFFCHRDMNWLLDEYEKGNKFFLYTGRGPSEKVHLGHITVWRFVKWLQDKFGAELYFQMVDDEKFLFKDKLSLEYTNQMAYDNALDVIALGFDPKKTHIFSDIDYANTMYPLALKVAKNLTYSTVKATFGFKDDNNVGEIFFTSMQAVPCFLPSVKAKKNIPCLIPLAIDQDAHFRIARDIMPKLGHYKPAIIHQRFLPALSGGGKMSASSGLTIYTTDTPKEVETKIRKYAFSGGKDTVKEHREKGGNPDIDTSYQWLTFFEDDDRKLKQIYDDYKSGKLLSGELKQILIDKLNAFLKDHQEKREKAKSQLDKFILRD